MRTVFIDTNIILDVLLENEGFWQDSLDIFRAVEQGEIRACVSASSMTDIFYVARKKLTILIAREAIAGLLDLFIIIGIDGDDLRQALSLPVSDIEDALQLWCAIKAKADFFITRDNDGFKDIEIPVISPAEFKEKMRNKDDT